MNIEIPSVFQPLLNLDKRFVILRGGRLSGKSEIVCQLAMILTSAYPNVTVIVCRDSFSDLQSSSYQQINDMIEANGLKHYTRTKVPLEVINNRNGSNIMFLGIGGADIHRTKSVKPRNKVIAVIYEELQQVSDQESLEQASASFRRHLDTEKGMMIHIFNPMPQNNHWLNKYWNAKVLDKDWLCIHSTYEDIVDYINDVDLKEILKLKKYDYTRYDWMYLGNSVGNFGGCYPQFKRDKHFKTLAEAQAYFSGQKIIAVIIGGDGAVNNDCTVFTPQFVFSNGQTAVGKLFYHNPKLSGVKSSAELMPYIQIWFKEIIKENGLGEIGQPNIVPILFKIDSAAAELIRNMRYFLSNRAGVQSFNKPTIIEMVDIVQSALAKNMIIVINYGGYYDYVRGQFVKGDNPLAYQLEMVQWNERQTGYDPAEPNDCTDALTYGTNTYFKNPDNLHWLDTVLRIRKTYYEIKEQ